jgi:Flp pilus assembly protein TadD
MKKNNNLTTLSALCLCAGLSMFSIAAHAMGDDSEKTPDCPKGQVYDSKTKSCMVEKGSKISDQDKTQYAYHLAKTGRFQEALDLLDTLQQPNTREAWNYRGYATRKLGRTDEGIGYYQRSIALDGHYAKVREYLGEAYMIKGRPDLAKAQLATIKGICGTGCEEYRDLNTAIEGHPES